MDRDKIFYCENCGKELENIKFIEIDKIVVGIYHCTRCEKIYAVDMMKGEILVSAF